MRATARSVLLLLVGVPQVASGQGDSARGATTIPAARPPAAAPAPTAPAATAPTTATPAPGSLGSALARRATVRAQDRYDETFRRYSKRYFGVGFDWRWFKAQGMAESRLDANATSRVGARGIMQLMPATFAVIQSKRPEFTAIDDPEWNIAAGIMHDRYLWRLWGPKVGDADRFNFMFASYNAGEGTIGRAADSARVVAGGVPAWLHVEQVAPKVPRWRYRETLVYVRAIDTNYTRLKRKR